MPRSKREPCPAGIEDKCPIPRYRCREAGKPGEHCSELFAEFEMFVLPDTADSKDADSSTAGGTDAGASDGEGDVWTF